MEDVENNDQVIQSVSHNDKEPIKRVQAFDVLIERYIHSIFGDSGFENALAQSFKPVYKTDKTNFMSIAREIGKSVREEVIQQIEDGVSNLEIKKKLNELDILEKHSDKEHLAWRPSSEPEKDIKAHLYEAKLKHYYEHKQEVEEKYESLKKELNEKLQEYQKKKEVLVNTIKDNEEAVKMLQKPIEALEEVVSSETQDLETP